MVQARGSATRLVIDRETAYATPKTAAKTGKIMPFNSCDVRPTQALNNSATLRNDRNPSAPFVGFKDVAGNVVVPVVSDAMGYWLALFFGDPTTLEAPILAASGGSNIMTGTPTITIAGGSGAYTLSAAHAAVAVGDRIIYAHPTTGVRSVGYVTTDTDDDEGVLETTRAGGTASANVTAAPIVAIMDSLLDATPGTVSITSGTATFSQAQANLAVGQMFIYLDTTEKYAYVTAKTSSTVCTVVDWTGKAPGDVSTKAVQWLGIASQWNHTFLIDPTDDLPSFLIEKGFTNMSPAHYELNKGCKLASMEIAVGGDGELVATFGVMGSSEETDSSSYDSAATNVSGFKFQNFHGSVQEGGSPVTNWRNVTITVNNDLDGDTFAIAGGAARGSIAEGIAQVGGTLNALFNETSLLAKADGDTESSLDVDLDPNTVDFMHIAIPEAVYSRTGPAIQGSGNVLLDLTFGAFYNDNADASAIKIVLQNSIQQFLAA